MLATAIITIIVIIGKDADISTLKLAVFEALVIPALSVA